MSGVSAYLVKEAHLHMQIRYCTAHVHNLITRLVQTGVIGE